MKPMAGLYFDKGRLQTLQTMLCNNLESLFEALGISLYQNRKLYYGPCPVHGGDNPGAINLYKEGDCLPGYWRCNTRKCHEVFKPTIIGFIRGVLSNQKFNWQRNGDRTVAWNNTVDWCCQLFKKCLADIEVDVEQIEKINFSNSVNNIVKNIKQEKGEFLRRDVVRKFLKIPSTYFVNRGFSPEILDKYDVGEYPAEGKPLSNKVAVPIYSQDYKHIIGFTARSIFEKCSKCNRWHNNNCPDNNHETWKTTSKWYNHNFNRDSCLYNYWFAKKHIKDSRTIILVEGPGDVWKLEQAGFHNSVAILGSDMSDEQQIMIEISGAMTIIVLGDMDEAGNSLREQIKRNMGRIVKIKCPVFPAKDIGEMGEENIKKILEF